MIKWLQNFFGIEYREFGTVTDWYKWYRRWGNK